MSIPRDSGAEIFPVVGDFYPTNPQIFFLQARHDEYAETRNAIRWRRPRVWKIQPSSIFRCGQRSERDVERMHARRQDFSVASCN